MRSIYGTPTFVWYLFRWHWSQEGMMDCAACSLGTFADAKGMKSCLQCGANVTLDTARLALFTTSQLVSARVLACHKDFLQLTVSVSVFCAFYCRIIWAAVLHLDLKIFGFGHPCITIYLHTRPAGLDSCTGCRICRSLWMHFWSVPGTNRPLWALPPRTCIEWNNTRLYLHVSACIGCMFSWHGSQPPQNSTFFTAVQLKTKRIVGSLDQIMKGGEPPVEPFQWFEYILMVSSRKHGAIGRWHFDTLCICSGYPYRMFWWDFASNVFHAGSICEGSKLLLQQGLWELGLIVGPRVKSQMQYRPSLQNYFFQALSWIGQQTGCASPFSAMCCLTSWATTRNCVMMTCQLL